MFRNTCFLLAPLAVLLVLMTFVSKNTNGKTILTDAEMSNVYGGGNCLYCAPWGEGCPGYSREMTPFPDPPASPEGYEIVEKDSCTQSEDECQGPALPTDSCTDGSTACTGTYHYKYTKFYLDGDPPPLVVERDKNCSEYSKNDCEGL